jgi:hypothetical protein
MVVWHAQLRSDARHVSKARLLSQALRFSEVADSPHHCLSAGLLLLMQDWALLHRCLVLDRPNTSDSMGPMDTLHGTPSPDCSETSSFLSLTKFIVVLLANPFSNFAALTFPNRISMLFFLVLLCCISSLGKGLSARC